MADEKIEPQDNDADSMDDAAGWAMGSTGAYDDGEADDGDDETGSSSDDEATQPELPVEGTGETDTAAAISSPEPAAPQQAAEANAQYTEHDYLKGVGLVDDELEKLATRYENGEIDFSEYRKGERKLLDDRSALQNAALTAKVDRERQERDWESAASEFAARPENRYFQVGQPLSGMMRETLERKFRDGEHRNKSHKQILDESAAEIRDGLRAFLGLDGTAGAPSSKAVDDLKARREKRLASATSTPAKAGKPTESPNPYEGWAAHW